MIYKGELPPLRVYAWKVCGKVHDMTVTHGYIKLYLKHRVYANIYVPDLADLHAMIYKISEAAKKLGVAVRLERLKSLVFNLVKEMRVLLENVKSLRRSIKRALKTRSWEELQLAELAALNLKNGIENLLPDLERLYYVVEEAEARRSATHNLTCCGKSSKS